MFLNYRPFPSEPSNHIAYGSKLNGNVVEEVVYDGTEEMSKPFEHIDARSFSLRSVIDSGGNLKPAPRIQKSNLEARDRVDSFVNSNPDKFN